YLSQEIQALSYAPQTTYSASLRNRFSIASWFKQKLQEPSPLKLARAPAGYEFRIQASAQTGFAAGYYPAVYEPGPRLPVPRTGYGQLDCRRILWCSDDHR